MIIDHLLQLKDWDLQMKWEFRMKVALLHWNAQLGCGEGLNTSVGKKTVQSCQVLMIPTTTDIPREKIGGIVGKHHRSFPCLCCKQPSLDGELGIAKLWACSRDCRCYWGSLLPLWSRSVC